MTIEAIFLALAAEVFLVYGASESGQAICNITINPVTDPSKLSYGE